MSYDLTPTEELRDLIAATITPHLYYNYSEWHEANDTDRETAREMANEIIDELTLREELGEGDNPRLSRYVTDWSQR